MLSQKKGKTVYIFKQVVQIQGFVKFEALHRRHLFSFVLLPVCLSRQLLSAKEYSRNFLIVDCEKDKHKSKTSLTETLKVNLREVDISMILKNKYFSNYQKLLNS